ncbi:MAG: hypothetical protein IJD01_01995 [Clostridia bacterium]|nr:hypothetical protein [Clostridia bacterium]
MKRSMSGVGGWIAAFGIGVLLSILLPSDWMLVVTVVLLITVAVSVSTAIRG